jgi:hypothetical protein
LEFHYKGANGQFGKYSGHPQRYGQVPGCNCTLRTSLVLQHEPDGVQVVLPLTRSHFSWGVMVRSSELKSMQVGAQVVGDPQVEESTRDS